MKKAVGVQIPSFTFHKKEVLFMEYCCPVCGKKQVPSEDVVVDHQYLTGKYQRVRISCTACEHESAIRVYSKR